MKIFFSYPHDANAELVSRFHDDLEKLGHEVWFDRSEIKHGDDWRESITRGILDSERAVAFLSKHSTRDPGVCLNEIAIVQAEKGDALVTVLVEPSSAVNPPVCITHIQWLPMEDWKAHFDQGGPAWEEWYRKAFSALVAVLDNPAEAQRNSELDLLKRVLMPLSFNAEIAQHVPTFHGREWVFERYDRWLGDERSRVFRIEGGPGMGKSAIAARLGYAARNTVIGIHLCKYNMGDSRDPRRMVMSLAWQMASRLPDYRTRLLAVPLLNDLTGKDAVTLWNALIAEPLRNLIPRPRHCLVIDALDEATENGRNAIVDLLATGIEALPKWIGIVITNRPDEEIRGKLQRYSPFSLSGDDPQNLEDIRAWLADWLASPETGLDASQQQTAQKALLARSEGTFLYLREVREQWESERQNPPGERRIDLANPGSLPNGLAGIYLLFFERRFGDPDAQAGSWQSQVLPIVELMLASPEPLPVSWLGHLLGWTEYEQDRALRRLGSLFPLRPGLDGQLAISPFHKSVGDWLLNRQAAGAWWTSTSESRKRLTAFAWRAWKDSTDRGAVIQAVLPNLLEHMDPAELNRLFDGASGSVLQGLSDLAGLKEQQFRYSEALSLRRMQAAVSDQPHQERAGVEPGDTAARQARAMSHSELGRLLTVLHLDAEAREHVELANQLYRELKQIDWAVGLSTREHSVNLTREGTLLVKEHRLAEALSVFERGLAISRQLSGAAPGDRIRGRDLVLFLQNSGRTATDLGHWDTARSRLDESIREAQRLLALFPGDTEITRDLAASKAGLAHLAWRAGPALVAIDGFQQSLQDFASLAARDPTSLTAAHDLAIAHWELGRVFSHCNRHSEGLEQFRKALDIASRLVESAPESPDFRESHELYSFFVGGALFTLNQKEQAAHHLREFLDLARTSKRQDAHSLFRQHVAAINLGDINVDGGQIGAAMEYYRTGLDMATQAAKVPPDDPGHHEGVALALQRLTSITSASEQEGWIRSLHHHLQGMKAKGMTLSPYFSLLADHLANAIANEAGQ